MALPEVSADRTREFVAAQLGREPRGDVAVAVRCEHGLPLVVRTAPRLETGEPFPTLFWLTCPLAVRSVGALEASGAMRAYRERLAAEPALAAAYREAHERYRLLRDGPAGADEAGTAGGMPGRVKCLHALYAHELADANPIGAMVRREVEPLGCPGPCVEERDGALRRVADHPARPRKRRR